MDKLIYERDETDYLDIGIREPIRFVFELPEDLNIHEFRITCMRLAHALGYHHNSIKDGFGDEFETPAENKIRDDFLDLMDKQNK